MTGYMPRECRHQAEEQTRVGTKQRKDPAARELHLRCECPSSGRLQMSPTWLARSELKRGTGGRLGNSCSGTANWGSRQGEPGQHVLQ